jgi:hypothetical protein
VQAGEQMYNGRMTESGIKWAVEYPAALANGTQMHDFSERTTSPAFHSRAAAQEQARALVEAYRDVEMFGHTDGTTISGKPFYRGSPPPGTMHVLVKPIIA